MRELVNSNYVTAVGFDYTDGKYKVIVQLLDFSSIAKQPNKVSAPAQTWIGSSEGITVNAALNSLYKSSQQQTDWDHVNVLVFTDAAVRHGVENFLDGLFRFRSIRYTCWVYGTHKPIRDVFSVNSYFNQSAFHTVLHAPEHVYKQRSVIRPIRYMEFNAKLKSHSTVILPSLDVTDKIWFQDQKPDDSLFIDGLYTIRNGKKEVAWFQENQVTGIRWFDERMAETPLTVFEGNDPVATLKLVRANPSLRVRMEGEKPQFQFHLTVKGNILEQQKSIPESKLRELTTERIRQDIQETLARGIGKHSDLFGFEHVLYKQRLRDWERLTSKGSKPFTYETDQVKLHIDVQLQYEGRYQQHYTE